MTLHGGAPAYDYIAYIDEAGDPGIRRVRPIDNAGSTEWFVLGAILVRAAKDAEAVSFVRRMIVEQKIQKKTDLHFRHLSEAKKGHVCAQLAQFPSKAFVVASNKRNMRGHRNDNAAKVSGEISSSQLIYNYCARILLERITAFVEAHSIREFGTPKNVKIIFSTRGGHNYGQLFAYLELLKMQARAGTTYLKKREIKWSVLQHSLLEKKPHWTMAGLQLADVVASAFYQAIDVLDVANRTCAHAKALTPLMVRQNGLAADFGVTLLPHPKIAALTPARAEIFNHYGYKI